MKHALCSNLIVLTMAFMTGCAAAGDPAPGDEQDPESANPVNETVATAAQALTSVAFSTYLGGSGTEYATGPAVDGAGNVYVAGRTTSYGVGGDIFVAKFSPTGAMIYFTYFGGSGSESPGGIAVDSAGNAYVAASTTSYGPSGDILVAKLNAAGNALVYSSVFGGSASDMPTGIAVDGGGNVYLSGQTYSADYPTTAGAFQRTHRGDADAFVTKLNASGNTLLYSTYLGGDDVDAATGIAVDAYGYAYVTGYTYPHGSTWSFPTTGGAFQTTAGGGSGEAFVAELVPSGSSLYYSTYLGGSSFDRANGIAVDSAFNAYVTGVTFSLDFPVSPGAFRTSLSSGDAFVTKLNAYGSGIYYSTYLGGSDNDEAAGIALNSAGNAYVTGSTTSTSFPLTPGAFRTSNSGGTDTFVTELSTTGAALAYSTYVGGSLMDVPLGIAVGSGGNAYVGGTTFSTSFPVVSAAQPVYGGGAQDGFVLKISGP